MDYIITLRFVRTSRRASSFKGAGREQEPASDGKDPTRAVNRYGSTRSMNLCIHTWLARELWSLNTWMTANFKDWSRKILDLVCLWLFQHMPCTSKSCCRSELWHSGYCMRSRGCRFESGLRQFLGLSLLVSVFYSHTVKAYGNKYNLKQTFCYRFDHVDVLVI